MDFNYTVKPDKATGQPIHIKPATVTYRPEGDSKSVQVSSKVTRQALRSCDMLLTE